ncbi:adenylate/guanylate cyclase domain-containing protein [candidate division KSB1 bacterium]|nr:adenylate/guanylate cyclase domain-containing protein [candidate division KSB1 bacterium]
MRTKLSKRIVYGVLLGLSAAGLILLTTYGLEYDLFEAFEAKSLDWRYIKRLETLWERRDGATIEDIIIVDIDNRSLEKLGRFDQWPRSYHAQLIDYMSGGGARAIAFDVLFMEPDQSAEMDSTLIAATATAGNVYHAMAFSMADANAFLYPMDAPPEGFRTKKFSLSLPDAISSHFRRADRMDGRVIELYNAAAGIGYANFSPDNDSVIRTMPMFLNFAGHQYLSLTLAMIVGITGADPEEVQVVPDKEIIIQSPGKSNVHIPINRDGRMLISYQGTFQTFRYVSYYDVLMQRLPQEMFQDKIVFIGTSAAGLADIRPVPFQDAFPGVEVHANILYDILNSEFIKKQSPTYAVITFVMLALTVALLAMLVKPWISGLITVALIAGYAYLSTVWFAADAYWLELIRPLLSVFFAYLFVLAYRYVDEERNKRYIKNMFQHYLTASVVEELLKSPDMLKLGGERRIATVFFSDIKSFTTVSEKLQPETLIEQLNEYLSAMTEVVLKYEGYLDKYEGDAIMAVFGVPVEQSDHARRGCMAALEMQKILIELRKKWRDAGKPEFHVRMGLNSGPMIAGNIGGKDRFDYTVIGDAVNLASRLEGANKEYGTNIMISESTAQLLEGAFIIRELDSLRVKGKLKPVIVYELLAAKRGDLSIGKIMALEAYEEALKAYRQRKWDSAIEAFQRALAADVNDGPSAAYIERCRYFKKHPVPLDWDGVFEMKTK